MSGKFDYARACVLAISHIPSTSHQRPRERSHNRRAQHRQSRNSRSRGRTIFSSTVITAGAAALVRRGAAARRRGRGRGLEDRASARAGRREDGAVEREDLDVVHFEERIGVVGAGAVHVVDVLRKRNTEVSEAPEFGGSCQARWGRTQVFGPTVSPGLPHVAW